MFHIELRKFPQNTHAFNLTEPQLRGTILAPWLRNQRIELGGHRWLPETTQLTILEGPELTIGDMAMGRGWTAAKRKGVDVTQQMLAPDPPGDAPELDELARELLAACAEGLVSAHDTWRLAGAWHPAWRASDRLVAAEGALRLLLLAGYATLCRGSRATAGANVVPGPEIEALLLALETWLPDSATTVFLAVTDSGRQALLELATPPVAD
jgi:hypothetical protein